MMRVLWIVHLVLFASAVLFGVVLFAKWIQFLLCVVAPAVEVGSADMEVAAIVAAVVLFLFLVAYGWACASGVIEYSKASALRFFASYLRCTALAIAGVFALRLAWQLICGTA